MRHVTVDLVDPVRAVQYAYFCGTGCPLDKDLARRIVNAVQGCADTLLGVGERIPRLLWENNPRFQADVRASLRRQLLHDAMANRLIPTDLPTEVLRFYDHRWSDSDLFTEVTAAAVAHGAPWDSVEVRLTMPARVSARI